MGIFLNVDINAYNGRRPKIVRMANGPRGFSLDSIDEVLQGARTVSLCNYYHATMRHVLGTIDTRQCKYDSNGGTGPTVHQVRRGGDMELRSQYVIGSPLTLVPALYDIFGRENAQVNALKAQLVDYYERLQDLQRGVISGRYNWKKSWRCIMKDIHDILSKAPILRERSMVNAQGGVVYARRRHAVFAPMSNVEIDAMRQHALASSDEKNDESKSKYFRMCESGAHGQVLYRVYNQNFHKGLFGQGLPFPQVTGERGVWDRAGAARAQVHISGAWTATLTNGMIICIKRVDADGTILDTNQAFGVMLIQFDIVLEMAQGSQLRCT